MAQWRDAFLVEPDPRLVQYGIQTSKADFWAHVSSSTWTIFIYPTWCGVKATEGKPINAAVKVNGVRLAEGHLVPPSEIECLHYVPFPSWKGWSQFAEAGLSTTAKGALAVQCVIAAVRRGLVENWPCDIEEAGRELQLQGIDLVLHRDSGEDITVEVKCDTRGGDRPEGSGNLFLQRAELNPTKSH